MRSCAERTRRIGPRLSSPRLDMFARLPAPGMDEPGEDWLRRPVHAVFEVKSKLRILLLLGPLASAPLNAACMLHDCINQQLPLSSSLQALTRTFRDVVGHLEAKARALEADLDKEQARVAELEKRLQQQAALPLGIDLDLKSLCDYSREHAQAARQAGRAGAGDGEDGDASGAVIDLSRRHVHAASASADASAQAVSRVFNLGCSLRGGVLHLQALDVLRVHCAKLEGVEMQGHNAGSHTPVIVLRGPRMRVEDICVSRCSVRVLGAGARLLRCKVSDCEALPAIHVAGDADGPSGEDVPVTLHKCEAADSFIGLLVSGCPHLVLVTKCRCAAQFCCRGFHFAQTTPRIALRLPDCGRKAGFPMAPSGYWLAQVATRSKLGLAPAASIPCVQVPSKQGAQCSDWQARLRAERRTADRHIL